MPISTLIVDDEDLARSLVAALVRKDPELLSVGECSDGGAALQKIAEAKPDLVFLDIRMPVLNGLEVVERLLASDYLPYIIFVTAYDDYAIKAFELNVLDYLVKPIEKKRFHKAVRRAKEAIRKREMLDLTRRLVDLNQSVTASRDNDPGEGALLVRKGDRVVRLTMSDIAWVEAANQYVHIHTGEESYTLSESLSQFQRRIDDPRFVRTHRSALVNAAAIESVLKNRNGTHLLKLRTGHDVTVARSRSALLPGLLRLARNSSTRV